MTRFEDNRETTPMEIEINGITFEVIGETPMASSLDIAKAFEKRHDNVLRAIQNKMELLKRAGKVVKASYINVQGKEQPMYLLDLNSFTLVVMGFTGAKADYWKRDYIKAFNRLEDHYRNGTVAPKTGNPILDDLVAAHLAETQPSKW